MQWENDELICIDSIGKVPTRWDFNELITMRPESLIRQVKVLAYNFQVSPLTQNCPKPERNMKKVYVLLPFYKKNTI